MPPDRIAAALLPMRQQLQADGYDLSAAMSKSNVLRVDVVAGPDACQECLVSKDLLTSMILAQIVEAGIPVAGVELVYPAE